MLDRRKGVGKDIHYSSQNAALFVDLLQNIFCQNEYMKQVACQLFEFQVFLIRHDFYHFLNWQLFAFHKLQYNVSLKLKLPI